MVRLSGRSSIEEPSPQMRPLDNTVLRHRIVPQPDARFAPALVDLDAQMRDRARHERDHLTQIRLRSVHLLRSQPEDHLTERRPQVLDPVDIVVAEQRSQRLTDSHTGTPLEIRLRANRWTRMH